MFLQLVAAFMSACFASSDAAVPVSEGHLSIGSLFFDLGLDCAMQDAITEAMLCLTVFGAAWAIITYRKRTSKGIKLQQKKSMNSHRTPSSPARQRSDRGRLPISSGAVPPRRVQSGTSEAMPSRQLARQHVHHADRILQVETDGLANAVRAGRSAHLPQLLDTALARILAAGPLKTKEQELVTTLLHAALRACAANRCFTDAITAYNHLAGRVCQSNAGLWSVLLFCIVEAGEFSMCKSVFQKLRSHGNPTSHDFVNMVRCYVGQEDPAGLCEMLRLLSSSGQFVDNYAWNRALAACGSSQCAPQLVEVLVDSGVCAEGLDAVGYNTLMKYSSRAGQTSRCFELYKQMKAKGLEASEVTFGILLDACVAAKELTSAREVFDALCSSGLRLNVVHFTTFIKGLLGAGKLDEAASVLQEMARSEVKPDLITYSTVVKAYAETGDVCSAMKILKQMIAKGVRPDEIIFHAVLTGCCVFPTKSDHVMRAFHALRDLGMQPTTTTLSILLKCLSFTQAWSLSLQLLKDSPQKFGLEPEARLFVQMAQACVKAHDAKEVLPITEAMLDALGRCGEPVPPPLIERLVRCCLQSGETEVAVQLQKLMQRAGVPLEPRVDKMVTSALMKKVQPGRR